MRKVEYCARLVVYATVPIVFMGVNHTRFFDEQSTSAGIATMVVSVVCVVAILAAMVYIVAVEGERYRKLRGYLGEEGCRGPHAAGYEAKQRRRELKQALFNPILLAGSLHFVALQVNASSSSHVIPLIPLDIILLGIGVSWPLAMLFLTELRAGE